MFYSCLCDVGDFLVDSTLAVKFKDHFWVIFQVYGISTLCPSSFSQFYTQLKGFSANANIQRDLKLSLLQFVQFS